MLRFRNPLSFPMTTAPATIVANDVFFGQNTSFWAAPGEMTKIPVTKSMSVRVKAEEFERTHVKKSSIATNGTAPNLSPAFSGWNSDAPAATSGMAFDENEETTPVKPKYVTINGNQLRVVTVDVELTIMNRRAEPIKMIVNRRFSGELEQAVEGARVVSLGDDLSYINRKREISWEITLEKGETRKLGYAYITLVR